MIVSLFTARIVLQTLGVTDYGINNVVGGVVAMLNFLSGSLSHATNRFFSFELGQNNYDKLQKIFALLFILFFCCATVASVIADVGGLWWVNHKLVIPVERLDAAQFVLHASVFCFFISMMQVPYLSLIIAHENMSFFAWMSIADVLTKLLAVCSLVFLPFDHLKTLATLGCITSFMIFLIYHTYCRKKYPESKFKKTWNKPLFMEILSYSSYNLTTQIGTVLKDQGVNILLNMFYGPAINAARGIAFQINTAVSSFMLNVQTAANPQIIKSYSSGNYEYMQNLIIRFTRINYYIMLFLCLPIILNINFILKIWLGIVPDYTAAFVIVVLITSFWTCFGYSLLVAVRATGHIKNLQIGNTIIILSVFPVSYIFCRYGLSPTVILGIPFFESMFMLIWGIICLKRLMNFPFRKYTFKVFPQIIITTLIAASIPLFLKLNLEKTTVSSMITIFVSFVWLAIVIFIVGLTKFERKFVIKQIKLLNNYFKILK
jgi:O-antigen/teichoic acid export membrane protein